MRHVTCGRSAYDTRRAAAHERLGAHLSTHKKAHEEMTEEEFKSHETRQKAEYGYVGDLISGKASKKGSKKAIEQAQYA